jgi:hypothetical protein
VEEERSAMALPTTPAEWLALAEETRAATSRMTPDAHVTMFEVAADYERMAAYMAESADGDD